MRIRAIAFLVCVLGALFGCADHDKEFGDAKVNVAISALTAADVASVTVTVTASDISPAITAHLTKVGSSWQGTIPNIPAGSNRTFSAQASDAASVLLFQGSATNVTITAGNTAVVMIVLQEATPPGPFDNSAPYITSFWISSDQVEPSTNVILGAQATDPDGDPLTFAWTSTAGTFSAPSQSDTNWQAPATDGAYPITITVTDPHAAADSLTATVTVQTASATTGSADVDVTFNVYPRVTNVTSTLSRLQNGGPATMLHAAANDADGDTLWYTWSSNCSGTFTNLSSTSPDTTFALTDANATMCALTVVVNDQHGGQTTGTIHVIAGPPPSPNHAPVVTASSQSAQTADHNGQVSLHIGAVDPDGEPISFSWTASYGSLSAPSYTASTSDIVWTAPSCFAGPATITAHAIDGVWDTSVDFTITNESTSCPGTFNGDMTIGNDADLAQLNGIQHITGSLYIATGFLSSLDLSQLTAIDGVLSIAGSGMIDVNLPSLTTLGGVSTSSDDYIWIPQVQSTGTVALDNNSGHLWMDSVTSVQNIEIYGTSNGALQLPSLTTIAGTLELFSTQTSGLPYVPNLTTIGELYVSGNSTDITVDLPKLAHIGIAIFEGNSAVFVAPLLTGIDDLRVSQASQTSLNLPSSTIVASLTLSSNANLSSVSLSYASTASVYLYGNDSLTDFTMAGVTTLGNLTAISNGTLGYVAFPQLISVSGNLDIESNTALFNVSVPSLTSIGGALIAQDNPQLPQCEVDQIVFAAQPSSVSDFGNGVGPCP